MPPQGGIWRLIVLCLHNCNRSMTLLQLLSADKAQYGSHTMHKHDTHTHMYMTHIHHASHTFNKHVIGCIFEAAVSPPSCSSCLYIHVVCASIQLSSSFSSPPPSPSRSPVASRLSTLVSHDIDRVCICMLQQRHTRGNIHRACHTINCTCTCQPKYIALYTQLSQPCFQCTRTAEWGRGGARK